jgi:uncharacterized protein (DUF362 family)
MRAFHSSILLAFTLVLTACPRDAAKGTDASAPPPTDAATAPLADTADAALPDADVVTHASWMADDAGSAVRTTEAVDADALRAKHRARLSTQSPVRVIRGTTARELGDRICREVVPVRPHDAPVLIKPNLGGFDWFKDPGKSGGDDGVRGRITDPEFVRGIVRCLKARGHTNIVVAEGWGATHKDWERLVKVSGYDAMTREEGVPLLAMDDDGVFDADEAHGFPGKAVGVRGMEKSKVPTLLMPKLLADVLDHGLFISAPKVKAHRFGVVSMSVKGVQGTIMLSDASPAFRQKWRMHKELNPYLDQRHKKLPEDRALYVSALETFAGRIADVLEVETPDVVLADGAPMMSGDGFQRMLPSDELVAIGGENPILVDRVGAELLGLWDNEALARELGGHRTSPLIEVAAKRFGLDLVSPVVMGDGADLLRTPRPVHFYAMAPFSIESEAAGVTRPNVHAPHVDGDLPVIDGRGVDAAWSSAAPAVWDTDTTGTPVGIITRARFVWSKGGLYALWELSNAGLHVDTTRPIAEERAKLYEEDCVEMFLTPKPSQPTHYFEVELGPFGHFFDIDVDRTRTPAAAREDTKWSSGVTVATTRDATARTATIEAVFAAKDILAALTPGARLRLGLYRIEGAAPRTYLAWSPPRTKFPDFHVPSAFGTLTIDP